MTINLSDADKTALLELAPSGARKGRVCFGICTLCGYAEWSCSDSSEPDEVVVGAWDYWRRPCPRCEDVARRAPEIYRWVVSVLDWRTRQHPAAPLTEGQQ